MCVLLCFCLLLIFFVGILLSSGLTSDTQPCWLDFVEAILNSLFLVFFFVFLFITILLLASRCPHPCAVWYTTMLRWLSPRGPVAAPWPTGQVNYATVLALVQCHDMRCSRGYQPQWKTWKTKKVQETIPPPQLALILLIVGIQLCFTHCNYHLNGFVDRYIIYQLMDLQPALNFVCLMRPWAKMAT